MYTPKKFREHLMKSAALCISAILAIDRNGDCAPRHYEGLPRAGAKEECPGDAECDGGYCENRPEDCEDLTGQGDHLHLAKDQTMSDPNERLDLSDYPIPNGTCSLHEKSCEWAVSGECTIVQGAQCPEKTKPVCGVDFCDTCGQNDLGDGSHYCPPHEVRQSEADKGCQHKNRRIR